MATKKNDRETVILPRARKNEDPNLFVSVNGVAYLVPKGEATDVPPEVALEIWRAQKAETAMFDKASEMQKAAQ